MQICATITIVETDLEFLEVTHFNPWSDDVHTWEPRSVRSVTVIGKMITFHT